MKSFGGIGGDELIGIHDLLIAHHLADMEPHEYHIPQIAVAQRIPGIKDIVVAEGNIQPFRCQLLDAGDAPAFGIGVHPALEMGIDQGVGNKVDPGQLQQPHQPQNIGIVIGMHGGGVAGSHPVKHLHFIGPGRQGLQTTGSFIVNFVAVNIHQPVIFCRQFHGKVEGFHTILPGKFKMRNGAHYIGAHLHRVLHQFLAVGIAEDTFLGKSYDLDVHHIPQLLFQLQHGFHSGQLGVCDIHVGTDMLNTVGCLHPDRPVYPLPDIRLGQLVLALGPALDPLKKGAGHIPHRVPRRQAGVQVDMGFNERRQSQTSAQILHFFPLPWSDRGSDFCKPSLLNANIAGFRRVFQVQVFQQHSIIPFLVCFFDFFDASLGRAAFPRTSSFLLNFSFTQTQGCDFENFLMAA